MIWGSDTAEEKLLNSVDHIIQTMLLITKLYYYYIIGIHLIYTNF